MSDRLNLGSFEELVLLTVARLTRNAYGVTIRQALEEATKRNVAIGAVYTTLDRLHDKGFVTPRMGEVTPERGGKAKKYYDIEALGEIALEEAEAARQRVKKQVPVGTGAIEGV